MSLLQEMKDFWIEAVLAQVGSVSVRDSEFGTLSQHLYNI